MRGRLGRTANITSLSKSLTFEHYVLINSGFIEKPITLFLLIIESSFVILSTKHVFLARLRSCGNFLGRNGNFRAGMWES